jgi:hypothetical protein
VRCREPPDRSGARFGLHVSTQCDVRLVKGEEDGLEGGETRDLGDHCLMGMETNGVDGGTNVCVCVCVCVFVF